MSTSKFSLSTFSKNNLIGVHPDLVRLVNRAIQLTNVDFRVNEGLRSKQRQAQLVKSGASQTTNSRHLTGHAVDLVAWVDSGVRWDWPLYYKIAEAMLLASKELKIPLEWGGCWGALMQNYPVQPVGSKVSITELAQQNYVNQRRNKGLSAFIDGPHFQLPWSVYK